MEKSVLSKNVFNEKRAKYKFPLHILASDDTQEYCCPAHQNNLGEKHKISITNQGSAILSPEVHQALILASTSGLDLISSWLKHTNTYF